MLEPAAMSAHRKRWLDDPDGGGLFTGQRNAIRNHDQSCQGLQYAWLPRRKGATDIFELQGCDGECDVTFFVEGTRLAFEGCPDSWHYYCPCCLAKATRCPCGCDARRDQPGGES